MCRADHAAAIGGGGGPQVLRPQLIRNVASHAAEEFEPLSPVNPNPMMANDFGFYCVKTFKLP